LLNKDPVYLRRSSLPTLPAQYCLPTISNGRDEVRDMIFVVSNNAHIKGTNPGYSRKECGGFFCH